MSSQGRQTKVIRKALIEFVRCLSGGFFKATKALVTYEPWEKREWPDRHKFLAVRTEGASDNGDWEFLVDHNMVEKESTEYTFICQNFAPVLVFDPCDIEEQICVVPLARLKFIHECVKAGVLVPVGKLYESREAKEYKGEMSRIAKREPVIKQAESG